MIVDNEAAQTCAGCGLVANAATNLDDPDLVPEDGAVNICIRCGALSVFTGEGLKRREATAEELELILADPEIQHHLKAIAARNARSPTKPKLERLPCGCVIGEVVLEGVPVFVMVPHSLLCEVYKYSMDEARRQGKPIKAVMA